MSRVITRKQQLEQEAERLLLQSKSVRNLAQYAQGKTYDQEMERAKNLYNLHLQRKAEADECTC